MLYWGILVFPGLVEFQQWFCHWALIASEFLWSFDYFVRNRTGTQNGVVIVNVKKHSKKAAKTKK